MADIDVIIEVQNTEANAALKSTQAEIQGVKSAAGEASGEHAQFTRLFNAPPVGPDQDGAPRDAVEDMHRLNRHLVRKLNKGRRSIGSVLSEGEYWAVINPGYPAPFPAERPRYE